MPLEKFIQNASEMLKEREFHPLDEGGGDRHDAWQWTWVGPRSDGHAYVSMALLDGVNGLGSAEIWAGADDGVRFGRHLVRALPVIVSRYELPETLSRTVMDALVQAAIEAANLPDAGLTSSHIEAPNREFLTQ